MKELRAAAVGIPAADDRRHRAARVLLRVPLGSKHAEPARAVRIGLRRILRQRIAALHDPLPHDAMERRPRVRSVLRVLDEEPDVIRRGLRKQVDDDRAEIGLDHGLLVPHLLERQRRREELRAAPAVGRRQASRRADADRAADVVSRVATADGCESKTLSSESDYYKCDDLAVRRGSGSSSTMALACGGSRLQAATAALECRCDEHGIAE